MLTIVRVADIGNPVSFVASKLRISLRSRELARRFGYRPYMIERYYRMLGSWNEVLDLLNAFERGLNPVVRCNTLRVSDCSELVRRLESLGFKLNPIKWAGDCFTAIGGRVATLGSTHEFLAGMYYLYRGPSSLLPPLILNPSLEDRVCDLAAAPGGKTTHMAQLMRNEGVILASDINRSRLRALRSNVERLGVRNAVLLRIDGRLIPELFPGFFTKSLLDAPCSGEGLIMIDPGRKVRTGFNDLLKLHNLQVELLNAAIDSVCRDGLILYSTCSIAPEENELVIARVVEGRDDVVVESLKPPVKLSEGIREYVGIELPNYIRNCVRVWPHVHGMEGFFMCLLRRC